MDARPLPTIPLPARLGDRRLFPDLAVPVYVNHAAISPPSLAVRAAVQAVTDDYAALGSRAFLPWIGQRERLRGRLARLFGGGAEGWVLSPGTTRGLLDVATCLRWQPKDRILLFSGEFPANITPWQRAAQTWKLGIDTLPLTGFDDGSGAGLSRVERALQAGNLRLVAVSAVQFQTGLRMPLAELGQLCRRHGALLCVDGIQAAGAVPIDVDASGIDFFAAGTHKWAMGMDGAGFLYISPRGLAALSPRIAGWLSHEEGLRFLFEGEGHLRTDRPIRARADFLEVGAWNTMGFAALEAGLSLIESIGIPAIHAHVNGILDAIEAPLLAAGFISARARDANARSCTLSLKPPPGIDITQVEGRMWDRGVAASIPDGWLRISPHWPNGLDQVPQILDAVLAAAGSPAR